MNINTDKLTIEKYYELLERYTCNLMVTVVELRDKLEAIEQDHRRTMDSISEIYRKRIEALKEGNPYDIDGGKRKLI